MRPYIAILPDDHRVFGPSEASVWKEVNEYRRDHPNLTGRTRIAPITASLYNSWLKHRDDPAWWITFHQGDNKSWSSGKRELVAKVLRNIPKPRQLLRSIRGKMVPWDSRAIRAQTEVDMPKKYPLAHLFHRREVVE